MFMFKNVYFLKIFSFKKYLDFFKTFQILETEKKKKKQKYEEKTK